jgi:hypothetical protein
MKMSFPKIASFLLNVMLEKRNGRRGEDGDEESKEDPSIMNPPPFPNSALFPITVELITSTLSPSELNSTLPPPPLASLVSAEYEIRDEFRRRKEIGEEQEEERKGGEVEEWVMDLMMEEDMLRVGDEGLEGWEKRE